MALTPILETSWDQRVWFDSTATIEGWWDQDYIPAAAVPPGGGPPVGSMAMSGMGR